MAFSFNINQVFILFISFFSSLPANAQSKSNTEETFQMINEQVWEKFIESYSSGDTEGFLSIHSPELLRVPRDSRRISDFSEYYSRMKVWFDNDKSIGNSRSISFTFYERFNNGRYASEVGIYRVQTNSGSSNEREFYGKFHVILVNEIGVWKILMDSDSSEAGSIDKEDFEKGKTMDELETFVDK